MEENQKSWCHESLVRMSLGRNGQPMKTQVRLNKISLRIPTFDFVFNSYSARYIIMEVLL